MTLFFSFPPSRLLFDAGEETFPREISTFSGCTDRPSQAGQIPAAKVTGKRYPQRKKVSPKLNERIF
jgi:hypothetical protein